MNQKGMRRTAVLIFLCLLACRGEMFTVTRVIDGDTIELDNGQKVRLLGTDCPESVHPFKQIEPYGPEAAAFTRSRLEGRRVKIRFDNPENKIYTDRYGRWVAYVYLNGRLFNATLIRKGYARAYTKYPFSKMEKFKAYEEKARLKKAGMWKQGTQVRPSPTPP